MPTDYSEVKAKQVEVEKENNVEVTKPKKDAVVTKRPKKIKKGLMERLVVGLLGPDGLPSISHHLKEEIIMPAVKNILYDTFTSGMGMMLFKDDEGRPGGGRPTNYGNPSSSQWNKPKTNYATNYKPTTNYQNSNVNTSRPPVSKRSSGNHVEDYVITDRHEALGVLDGLHETILAYGVVSVADYYDMIGVDPSYTDNTWGWSDDDLSRATIVPTRGGYMLRLPPTHVI